MGITLYSTLIIIISLVLSFFFSGSETAFVSVNKVRIEVWRRRKDRIDRLIMPFMKFPERFLYTTLIGNNIFNVTFATFATLTFNQWIPPELTWLLIVILSLLVGEIIPKTVFRSLADWLIRKIVIPLEWSYRLFYPLIIVISRVSELLLSMLGYQKGELQLFFSKKDIEILLNESRNTVKQNDAVEGEFYKGILNLKELRVREAMVPRADIAAIPDTISMKELTKTFEKYGHMKLPVYKDDLDNIVGVVFLKELFLQPQTLQDALRPITYVPETKRCSELLSEFRQNNTSIAVVIDEYGGTDGIVTTTDLVEELFGNIGAEYVSPGIWVRKIADKTYRINTRIEIAKLNEILKINIPEGEYETLAGFLLTRFGSIPRRDDVFEYKDIKIIVTRATRRKIESVKIILP